MFRFGSFRTASKLAGGTQRHQHARDDLLGARTTLIIGRSYFEQFGLGEDDPQLIIQAVEQRPQFGIRLKAIGVFVPATGNVYIHAC